MTEREAIEKTINIYRLNKLNQLRSSLIVNSERSLVSSEEKLDQIHNDTTTILSIPEHVFEHYSDTDSISSVESIDSSEAIAHLKLRTNNFMPKEAIYDPTVLDSSSEEGECKDEDDTIHESSVSLCYSPTSSKTGLSFSEDQMNGDLTSITSPGSKELRENAPEAIYLPDHLISPPRINRTRNNQSMQESTDHGLLVLSSGLSACGISVKSLSPKTSSTVSSSNTSRSDSLPSMDSIKSSLSHDEIETVSQDIQSNRPKVEWGKTELDNVNDLPQFLIPHFIKKVEQNTLPFDTKVFDENDRSLSDHTSLSSNEPSQRNMQILSSDVIESFLPLIDLDLGSSLDDGDLYLSIVDCPRIKTKSPRQIKVQECVSKSSKSIRSFRNSFSRRKESNSDCLNISDIFSEKDIFSGKDTSGNDLGSDKEQKESTPTQYLCSDILKEAIGQSRRIKKMGTKASYQISNENDLFNLPTSEKTFNTQSSISVDITKTPCTLSYIEYLLERIEKNYYCDDFHEVSEALTDMLLMIDNNSNIDGSSEISAVIWYNEGLLYLFNSQYVQAIVAFGNAADIFEEKNRTKEYMACVIKVGIAYFGKGNFASSLGAFNKVINILSSQTWSCDWSRKVLAELMNNIACVHYMTGNTKESWKNFKEALTIQSSLSKTDIYRGVDNHLSTNSSILNYSLTLCNIGYLRLMTDKKSVSSAVKSFEDALSHQQQLEVPQNSQLYLSTLEYLSMANLCDGKMDISIKVLSRLLQIYIQHFGAHHQGCELTLSKISLISSPKNTVAVDISFIEKWKQQLLQDKDAKDGARLFYRLMNVLTLLKKHDVKKLIYIK